MKTRFCFPAGLLLALAVGPLFAAEPTPPPKPPAPPAISPRFLHVREKINTLFQHRNAPPRPLDPLGNPFRPPGALVVANPIADGPAPSQPSNDLSLLQEAAAALKVSGTVEKDGQPHLVINARSYKKGDVVPSRASGQAVYLRVREITRRSVTFELNDTEMTLKF
jgi:hypothetical protein